MIADQFGGERFIHGHGHDDVPGADEEQRGHGHRCG